MNEDRLVVATVLTAFVVGMFFGLLPAAVGRAGWFMPVWITMAITLLIGCFIVPAIAGTLIGQTNAQSREMGLIVLILGLPVVIIFSFIASGVLLSSNVPYLAAIALIVIGGLVGYSSGREQRPPAPR